MNKELIKKKCFYDIDMQIYCQSLSFLNNQIFSILFVPAIYTVKTLDNTIIVKIATI